MLDQCTCCLIRLAPLSVCLPTVSTEFARLAGRLRLMECGALLPKQGRGPSAARAARPLEMFFPFDPFLLRRSAQVPGPDNLTPFLTPSWRYAVRLVPLAKARGH